MTRLGAQGAPLPQAQRPAAVCNCCVRVCVMLCSVFIFSLCSLSVLPPLPQPSLPLRVPQKNVPRAGNGEANLCLWDAVGLHLLPKGSNAAIIGLRGPLQLQLQSLHLSITLQGAHARACVCVCVYVYVQVSE